MPTEMPDMSKMGAGDMASMMNNPQMKQMLNDPNMMSNSEKKEL